MKQLSCSRGDKPLTLVLLALQPLHASVIRLRMEVSCVLGDILLKAVTATIQNGWLLVLAMFTFPCLCSMPAARC